MWSASSSNRTAWVSRLSASASSEAEKKPWRSSSASRCGSTELSLVTSGSASPTQLQASPAKARSAGRSSVRRVPSAVSIASVMRIASGRAGSGAAATPVRPDTGNLSSGQALPRAVTLVSMAVTRSSPSYQP